MCRSVIFVLPVPYSFLGWFYAYDKSRCFIRFSRGFDLLLFLCFRCGRRDALFRSGHRKWLCVYFAAFLYRTAHRFFSQLLFPAAIFLSGFFLLGFVTVPCILFIKGLSFSLLFYGIIAAGAGTSPGRLAAFFLPDAVLVFPLLIVLGAVSLRSSLGLLWEHSKSGVRPGFRLNYFLLAAVVSAMLLRCFLAAAFSHFII